MLKLHYEFDFEPKSELFKTYPVFIVGNGLAESLVKGGFSGFEIADLEVSVSESFKHFNPSAGEPTNYSWLKVHGQPQIDDLGVNAESGLVVSKRVMDHIQSFEVRDFLKYDAEIPLKPDQIEDDLFEAARALVRKLEGEKKKR